MQKKSYMGFESARRDDEDGEAKYVASASWMYNGKGSVVYEEVSEGLCRG